MNFRPVKLESPFFKQLKNYKQLQEDFGKLQDDTGVNEMESFLKIEVCFLSFLRIQNILMQITEKTLFTSPFTDKQTVFQVKLMTSKMLTSKRAHIRQFTNRKLCDG